MISFVADKNCKYSKPPVAQDYIEQIKLNLGEKKWIKIGDGTKRLLL